MNGRINKKKNRLILYGALISNLAALAYTMRKAPRKNWIFVYLFNSVTNVAVDTILVRNKVLEYPIRLFPRSFKINVLFDLLIYPTMTVFYNKWTNKDKSNITRILKLLCFSVPFSIIEGWFHSSTMLIKWKRWYRWYHTFIGLTTKSYITRILLDIFRRNTKLKS
ncbi:hypothetical protein J2T17_007167 [Paenibacillus mucilaginosus]